MRVSKNLYYDINESDLYTNFKEMIFYFSSDKNKERFDNGILDYVKQEQDKILCKYHIICDVSKMLALAFYMRIEKRGFRVLHNSKPIKEYRLNLEFNI